MKSAKWPTPPFHQVGDIELRPILVAIPHNSHGRVLEIEVYISRLHRAAFDFVPTFPRSSTL